MSLRGLVRFIINYILFTVSTPYRVGTPLQSGINLSIMDSWYRQVEHRIGPLMTDNGLSVRLRGAAPNDLTHVGTRA